MSLEPIRRSSGRGPGSWRGRLPSGQGLFDGPSHGGMVHHVAVAGVRDVDHRHLLSGPYHPLRVVRVAGAGHRDILEHPETGRALARFVDEW